MFYQQKPMQSIISIMYKQFSYTFEELEQSYVILTQGRFMLPRIQTMFKNENLKLSKQHTYYESLADIIFQSIEGKLGVIFSCQGEGFFVVYLKHLEKVIKILIDKYNFDTNKLYLLTSSEPIEEEIQIYNDICSKNNLFPIKQLIYVSIFQHQAANEILYDHTFLTLKSLTPKLKKKNFLFFNGVVRPHRMWLIGEIFLHNLQDKFYISLQQDSNIVSELINEINQQFKKHYNTNKFDKIESIIKENIDMFPLVVSPNNKNEHRHNVSDLKLYNDSYISLVAETVFFKHVNIHNEGNNVRSLFITEKTWRPIKAKHPFIIAGAPNTLKRLKELGYKTFSPFINESYDEIDDDIQRLEAIIAELHRLCNFTDQEWLSFQEFAIPIIEHNFNTLATKTTAEYILFKNE